MPFTDPVSSISGRNSRASNVSGMTGASHSVRSGPPPPKGNDMLSNAGVLSMLKTTTDTGDIGALSINQTRLPTLPRPAHPRRAHAPRPSMGSSHHYPTGTSSHHYAPSQTSRISDSTSYARRGSFTSLQSMPPSIPPTTFGKAPLQVPLPTLDRSGRDSRSYSMTSAPSGQLPRHRSAASLKSAGHEPLNGAHLRPGPPPMPENRPPYVYPTRLKRPGYRSPSPAFSDLSSQGPPLGPPHQAHRKPSIPSQRPPPVTHHSDYGHGYGLDGNIHPPPRTMSISPPVGYEQPHFAYHPNAMRSAPALAGQQPMPPYSGPPYGGYRNGAGGPSRAYHAAPPYGPPRSGYGPHPPMQYSNYGYQGHRGPPPPVNNAPMAHHMFHNAARLARNLPHRTDTPLTDLGPPSSDPPSSGTGATVPTSSSPPTPRDHSTIQVAVDPLFIDPALTDLPDSSSEPVLPVKYLEYAEGLDKSADEPDMPMHHASVPPTGFVQRVKAMLESKAAVEAAAQREAEHDKAIAVHRAQQLKLEQESTDLDISEYHEMAANETPRFTIIEEFEAPVELPASPVKIPELSASPPKTTNRLTREMVKAELSPASTEDQTTTGFKIGDSSTEMVIQAELQREQSKSTGNSTLDRPETPNPEPIADTPSPKRQPSSAGSAQTGGTVSTVSPVGVSDYALRFSAPHDSTTQTDETQSRDPFILDADTITLQHQRSKEKTPQPEAIAKTAEESVDHHDFVLQPVSPLRSDEVVDRSSAVSPLQTQTLGIEETLRLNSDKRQDETTTELDRSAQNVTLSTEESLPPPTPRTPRTYSKSVQLPHSVSTITGTPTNNRYSLPPDLSTVAEITTCNTNSELVTDVAVRFSLPNTTITVGKPQIVTIPPSSSPDKFESPPPKSNARNLGPNRARRSSVTFADQVAPLNIKKAEPRREPAPLPETTASKARSIIRRPSPVDISTASSRSQESTTDLRFPGGNAFATKFASGHLPGLKEESVEDMSITDHKRSGSRNENNHPHLPARIAAVKAMQERRMQESAEKAKARRAARHGNRPIAEIRDLPSLNFSRMDLIDKLNEALEIRPAQSMEMVRRRDFTGIYAPSPQRPQSTEPLRDRYTSFFSKPEEFSSFFEAQESDDGEDGEDSERPDIPVVEVQESTKIEEIEETGSRPLSPEDFLSVATQVNRLSIPSMSGLSDKLSSLLPCLRNLHLDSVVSNDEEVAHTIDDIQHLGNGGRPDTVLSTRTSAGFRTLAERAEEIVVNSTHDSVVPVSRRLLMDKELPPLPESASADKVSAVNTIEGKQSYLSGSISAPSELGKELPARPSSALLRNKSPLCEEDVLSMLPPEMNPITRGKRSMIISSASRPWNQDENYPWAGSNVPVDLTIPSEVHTTDSSGLVRLGASEITGSGEPTDTSKGIDIGSIMTVQDCSASITTEQATGIKSAHNRNKSKRSIIGSISKKIGLAGRGNTLMTATADSQERSPSTISDVVPHKPGERYPTSGLTAPVNLQLDEVRSFFSDNSSERQRNSAFPKRLTKLRKNKAIRLDATRAASSLDIDGNTTYDAGALSAEDRVGATGSPQTFDGVVGMGKTEFRIKRFGERLRHLFVKGGELIRSLSKSSRAPRARRSKDDWLSDSLYSGV
ncbi:hypothetical protein EJ03DRAFT_156576 [Teratosphaeria nubilosa]|uniref:Uncharacterized protein n=1 Tax=Teratosphaeria nubilosa TaxID=161662 RepID=A0A6G1L395_9PEZI|nr:hypothetical protein EJ03DRAFT_156576 [Teratosphaeria nubilosa]